MAALLTSVLDWSGKISEYIAVCRDMGIKVLPPDVNSSEDVFSVENGDIRFGLAAIKNVGRGFMKQLVEERENGGKFASLSDFCARMYDKELGKRALEGLIKAGAFDSLGARRSQLLAVYELVVDNVAHARKKNIEGQLDLFALSGEPAQTHEVPLPDIPEYTKLERLSLEKESTGLYLSGHPMDSYSQLAKLAQAAPIHKIIDDLSPDAENPAFHDGMQVRLACVVTNMRRKMTRNGSEMAYLTVEDMSGSIEIVVFPKTLHETSKYFSEDAPVLLTGRIDAKEDEAPKIIASTACTLSEDAIRAMGTAGSSQQGKSGERLYLKVPDMQCSAYQQVWQELSALPGGMPVVFFVESSGKRLLAPRKNWVQKNLQLVRRLQFILGENNVIMK